MSESAAKKLLSEELIEERREEQRRENEQDAATDHTGGTDALAVASSDSASHSDLGAGRGSARSPSGRAAADRLPLVDVPPVERTRIGAPSAATVAFEEQHAHHMHILGLIRDEHGWALSRILLAERLEEAVRHVIADSPGTPETVKGYLRTALRGF